MEGAKVYTQDKTGEWHKATVVAALGGGKYRVKPEPWEGLEDCFDSREPVEVDASKMEGGTLPFQNSNMPHEGYPDMTTLDHLHEAALLHNLRVRFFAGCAPYTYTADIVIAVNPYRWFPQLYTDEMRKEYLVFDRMKLAPHVYATSSASYFGLQETRTDQAILVSGESGAGKTETVKILMGHLALIASSEDSTHVRRIVESNPLLESFGNAQTVRNDNSSRFGKFIELELSGACRLVGSRCRTYLLEKSRVVGQDAGERNYHIFYQMLAADPKMREEIGLGDVRYTRDSVLYTKLGASKTEVIEGMTDAERFEGTVAALSMVAVEGDVLIQLLRALVGALLLGQVEFVGEDMDEQAEVSEATAGDALRSATALGVKVASLQRALTSRTMRVRNENLVKTLHAEAALAVRDALAKELYSRAFDWLVGRICSATAAPAGHTKHFVGLLDIFGFESFAINRFEQFCINYANEKLQQKFTHDVFKAVQQEYADEGIPWDKIEFKDNAPVLELVESKLGIIAMLNEEGVRPKGSDQNFVSKLVSVHKADLAFSTPRVGKLREFQFTVAHYAGGVTYTTTGWLERNKDAISLDIVNCMRNSENPLVAKVFEHDSIEGSEGSKKAADTVASKFKHSLRELMDTIGKTNTQYVRCIKPNRNKSPQEVDNTMVVEQLRCAGVIEAIRISRAGFPSRMPLLEFVGRFQVIAQVIAVNLFGLGCDAAGAQKAIAALKTIRSAGEAAVKCRSLLSAISPTDGHSQIGRTRVYFKSGTLEQLEERRSLFLQAAATAISRRLRGYQARKKYVQARFMVLHVQALCRMRKDRTAYRRVCRTILLCQSCWRGVIAKRYAKQLRRRRQATRVQAFYRGQLAQRSFAKKRRAAVRIQAIARSRACRKQYLIDLVDSKEQAKLENQVKALKAKLEAQERNFSAQQQAAVGGTASSPAGPPARVSEPPDEILEALQALAAENAKLRMDLEHLRQDNATLRDENRQLRGQTAKSEWAFTSMLRSKGQQVSSIKSDDLRHKEKDKEKEKEKEKEKVKEKEKDKKKTLDFGSPKRSPPKNKTEPGKSPEGEKGCDGLDSNSVRLHFPLSKWWEDVPCCGLPLLKSGSEVHIKFGANLAMVDNHGKYLVWKRWMACEAGYTSTQTWFIEKRAPQRASGSRKCASSADEGGLEDGCLGLAFALRSAKSGKFLVAGGMFDRYRLSASGERPDDAIIFTFVPLEDSVAASPNVEANTAAEYIFALSVLGEKKMLKLRKDGYAGLTSVSDENEIHHSSMAASLEYLRPCSSYEITVHDKTVGLAVSKTLPLRVAGFNSMDTWGTTHVPGPAELTGRVKIGDIITNVNGQNIDGVPRVDALRMIACKRPVVLGFKVDKDRRDQEWRP